MDLYWSTRAEELDFHVPVLFFQLHIQVSIQSNPTDLGGIFACVMIVGTVC